MRKTENIQLYRKRPHYSNFFAHPYDLIDFRKQGEVIEFYLDEGEPVQSVSRSLKDEGHKLLDLKMADGYYVLKVEVV